jgi:hypothetical protein
VTSFARAAGFAGLAFTLGCANPYVRYATLVHRDVDTSIQAASDMTSRVQLSVVRGSVPSDSMTVVSDIVAIAAKSAREHATHFGISDPPPTITKAHLDLRAGELELAGALDSLSDAYRHCTTVSAADSTTHAACATELTERTTRLGFAMSDVTTARDRVQRALFAYGVVLGPVHATAAFVRPRDGRAAARTGA